MATPLLTTPVTPTRFFALTFALSWAMWIPLVLSHFAIWPVIVPEGTSNLVRLLGVLMPAFCAVALTARSGGRSAVSSLLRRLATWRVGWRWWAAVVLIQPILLILAAWLYNLVRPATPLAPVPFASIVALLTTTVALLIASLGEEVGWRGVALPALQMRRSPLASSVILGLLWATWHVPFWLLIGSLEQFGAGFFALNYLGVIPLTIFITWFFNHTRSSIFVAVVFHLVFNLVNSSWLPVGSTPGAFVILIVLEWLLALLVIPHLVPRQVQPSPHRTDNRGLG